MKQSDVADMKEALTDDEQYVLKDRIKITKFNLGEICDRLVTVTEQFSGLPYLYPLQKKIAYRFFEILLNDEPASVGISFSRQRGKTELFRSLDAAAMLFIPIIAKLFHTVHKPLLKFYNPDFPKNNGVWIGHMSNIEYQALAVWEGTYKILETEYAEMIMADKAINVGKRKINDKIKLTNGSIMQWYSLHPQAKVESGTFKVLQYDEAQDIDTARYDADASPMGAAWNASEFFFGVAGETKNKFWKLITNGEARRKKVRGYKRCTFVSDYKDGIRENPYYKAYIDKKKKELGEDSDEFQKSYCLKWLFEGGMAIDDKMLNKNKKTELELGWHVVKRGAELYFGLDFAKKDDKTVLVIGTKHWNLRVDLTIAPPKQVLGIYSWRGTDYDTQFYEICDVIDDFIRESRGIPIKMAYDSTGVGDAIGDRFVNKYEYEMEMEPIVYSIPMKSKLAKNLIVEMKGGRVWIPWSRTARVDKEVKELAKEVVTIEKKTKNQYIVCAHPERKGAHDDYFDGLSLMTWAAYIPEMGEVEEIKNEELVVNDFRRRGPVQTVVRDERDAFGRKLSRAPTSVYERVK